MKNSGFKGNRIGDKTGILDQIDSFTQSDLVVPTIDEYHVTDGTFILTGVTGVSAAGQVILVLGSGFTPGATVKLGTYNVPQTVYVNSRTIWFYAPALVTGTYPLIVLNALSRGGAGAGALVPGINYSGFPSIITNSNLGNVYEVNPVNIRLQTVLDSATLFTNAGALPPGVTLDPYTGNLSGTAPVETGSTTYTFTIVARDAQNQESSKTFNLTVNTDTVTWTNPTSNPTIPLYVDETAMDTQPLVAISASGSPVSYTATSLPTGLTLSGTSISGTPTSNVSYTTSTVVYASSTRSGRVAANTITWSILISDTFWSNTELALTGENNNPKPFWFSDTSSNNATLTVFGNPSTTPFSPHANAGFYSWGGGAVGPRAGVVQAAGVTSFPALGTNDFTVEAWVYPIGAQPLVAGIFYIASTIASDYVQLYLGDTGVPRARVRDNLGSVLTTLTSTRVTPTGAWTHFAVTRNNTTLSFWRNGELIDSVTGLTPHNIPFGTVNIKIGQISTGAFNGYISNVRYVNGTSLYNAPFTVPTAPLTAVSGTNFLSAQLSSFVDSSSLNVQLTADAMVSNISPFFDASPSSIGSTYFNNASYLTAPAIPAYNFGTGDFTIEFWAYPTANMRQDWIDFYSGGNRLLIFYDTGPSAICLYTGGSSQIIGTAPTFNAWNHIALSRNSGSSRLFLNGLQIGSVYNDTTNQTARTMYIGKDPAGSTYVSGYIADLRIINGTGLYTTTFDPPHQVTAVSGTSLLTMQYAGTANNNSVVDSGRLLNGVGIHGSPVLGSFGPYSPARWSVLLNNAVGNAGSVLVASTATLDNIAGDFTFEVWAMRTAISSLMVIAMTNAFTTTIGRMNSDGTLLVFGTSVAVAQADARVYAAIGKWFHLAVSRQSGTVYVHINGTQVLSFAYATAVGFSGGTGGSTAYIGNYNNNTNQEWIGYMSDLRITTGSAVYANGSTFTPSITTPLTAITGTQLLLFQGSTGIKNMSTTTVALITLGGSIKPSAQAFSPYSPTAIYNPLTHGGSVYFNGSSDYLRATYDANFYFGTRDFTVEFWMYHTNWLGGAGPGIGQKFGDSYGGWVIYRNTVNSNGMGFRCATQGGSSMTDFYSTSVPANGMWEHWAITRKGTTFAWFKNGVLDNTTVINVDITDSTLSGSMFVGFSQTWSYYFGPGYLSDVRVVVGDALYTTATNFTPPTTPLPIASSTGTTLLLLNTNNGTIIDYHGSTSLQTVGTARVSSAVKKFKDYSIYFNGSGSYLQALSTSRVLGFNTGDFTVELWVYFATNNATYNPFVRSDGSSPVFDFGYDFSVGQIKYSGAAAVFAVAQSLTTGQWYHFAISRSNGQSRLFFNGTQVGVTTADANNYVVAAYKIGGSSFSASHVLSGYIDNLRITKGVARYTANFPVATRPFFLR